MSHSDLTFITNEQNKNLADRFRVLIKDTRFFDCLVGYFYTSGFYALYKSLEKTDKIRILIGISTNKQVVDLIEESKNLEQTALQFSHLETKKIFSDLVAEEIEKSKDSKQIEEGIVKFQEWLRSGKLEIKAYPTENIHAKLYIMTFAEGDRDVGRVITGSSNFTRAGLMDNLEFNVELKNRSDYDFAEKWNNAEYKFMNKKIEKKKQELIIQINEFRSLLSKSVYPHHIKSDRLTMDIKDLEDNPKIIGLRDKLNKMATNIYNKHQELVKKIRKL